MKRSMNRFACGLTTAMMMGTLIACSGGLRETKPTVPAGSESAGNPENVAQQGEAQAEMKATVIWRASDDQSQNRLHVIIQSETEESGNITLDIQDAANDVFTVNSKLEVVPSKKTSVVAIYAPDGESTENIIKKYDADGMSAVLFSTEPMEDTMNRYKNIWHVGAQVRQSGEICAQALINYWNDNRDIADRNGDRKLSLVIPQGEAGQQDVTLRTDAYRETLEKNGIGYEILACDTASWNQAQALDRMNTWITVYGINGIKGALCSNDFMTMGTVQACINNGCNSGDAEKFVPIMGIDANIDALETTKAGSLLGTMLNDKKSQSNAVINMIRAVHAGTEITEDVVGVNCMVDERYIWIPYVIVDENSLSATLEDMLAVA